MTNHLLPVLSALAVAAAAPAQRDLATAFPATSWAILDLNGLDRQAAAFHDARLVGLLRQAVGEDGLASLQALVRERAAPQLAHVRRALAEAGLDANELRALLSGGLALGIGRGTLTAVGLVPSVALVAVDPDGTAAAAATAVADRLLAGRLRSPRSTCSIAGADFTRFELPQGAGALLLGWQHGHLLASNSAGYAADCLAALAGQTPSMASNPAWQRSRGKLAAASMASLFVNTGQLAPALAALVPYEADAVGAALGITGLPDLFIGVGHDGRSSHEVIDLTLPGPSDGLVKALLARPVSHRAARWVRADTALYATMSLDLTAAEGAFDRLLEALPSAVAGQIRHQLGRTGGREPGLAHAAAVAAALGSEVTLAFDLPQPIPPFATFTGFVEVRDMQAADRLLTQLAQDHRLPGVRCEEFEGAKVWSVDVETPAMRISPTCALRDGWLVFANFRNVVKRHLQNGDLGERSLAADPRFSAAVQMAPDAGLFVTGRLEGALQSYWGLGATALTGVLARVGFGAAEMPEAEEMAEALDDVVVALSVTDAGCTLRVRQPLGFGTLLPAAASGLDWLLRALSEGQPRAERVGRKIY